jgi:N-formylglutamate deformylase
MNLPTPHLESPPTAPPVIVTQPAVQTHPVVLASAHSGRAYAPDFLAASRLDPLRLRRSEDGFVDELFAAAPDLGMPLVAATFPRAWCDANREAWELDPAMFHDALPDWVNSASPRVAAGLGTIARVVASGEPIYRSRLHFAEAQARVSTCWRPFHAALEGAIARTQAQFGACLLLDCHSMPTPPAGSSDIVLGDAHGRACAPLLVRMLEQVLGDNGFTVRRNDPYAGGYITQHYGRPRTGVHVLQIEISRGLYMDEQRIERLPGFARLRARLTRMLAALDAVAPLLSGLAASSRAAE